MSRPLRGQRYAEGADPAMVALIEKLRDCRSFEVVREAYERFVPQMSPTEQALLAVQRPLFFAGGAVQPPRHEPPVDLPALSRG